MPSPPSKPDDFPVGPPPPSTVPDGQHMSPEQHLQIRALALSGKYTQRQIAHKVGCSEVSVSKTLRRTDELAKLVLDAASLQASHAIVKSFTKRPRIAMDFLDRRRLIGPPQSTNAVAVGVSFTMNGITLSGLGSPSAVLESAPIPSLPEVSPPCQEVDSETDKD